MDWSMTPIISSLAIAIFGWLGRKFIKSNDDKNRAEILTRIADDALSLVILKNPHLTDFQDLVRNVVLALQFAAPTNNIEVLQRVAASAVDRRVNRIGAR